VNGTSFAAAILQLESYYPDNVLKQIEEKMEIMPHLVKQTEHRAGFQMANAA
jgi:hypothetical protein